MALENDIVVATAAPRSDTQEHHSYIDWPAIIGGIVLASAISLLLLAFGSAIGLSFTNFDAAEDVNPIWIAIAGASWLLWVQISSFMAGGYLTGRLRRRFHDASEHESDVRDGAHGLLVWAGALLVGAVIAVGGVGAALNAAGAAIGTATTAGASLAGDAAGTSGTLDPQGYFIDTLFRTGPGASAATGATADVRGEAGRILAQAALSGSVGEPDRAYLAQLVAANSGLAPEAASSRVDETLAAIDAARAQAAAAAETARRWTVLAAFLTAATLLVSAVGAYWAAMKGGRHRDEGTVFADVFRRF